VDVLFQYEPHFYLGIHQTQYSDTAYTPKLSHVICDEATVYKQTLSICELSNSKF